MARRLAGVLGALFIAAPLLIVCSLLWLPVWVISPSKGDAIIDFAFDFARPFMDLMDS